MLTDGNNSYSKCSITDSSTLVQNNTNNSERIENMTLNQKYDKNLMLKLPLAEKEGNALEKWVIT